MPSEPLVNAADGAAADESDDEDYLTLPHLNMYVRRRAFQKCDPFNSALLGVPVTRHSYQFKATRTTR